MSDPRAMYEQVILDHNKKPRNYGPMPEADRVIDGYNPLCGDSFKLYLKFDGDTIADVSFDGQGCAVSKASASLMTTVVRGKTRAEAEELFQLFHHMLKSAPDAPLDEEKLGKLRVFSGVREYPVRVKCATLAWHTLHAAIEGTVPDDGPVTTE
ncbi:MAG: SUF system NifU family Fe-S cluster assembly protein [Candidatus Hydrogenedens sp.]|nr:SUF system NifU family Fe-S cluster assembly protein [Candidatus Hydrogenedentota bacterium]NLF57267.1 SUF system NifU family Fe-S cluster assembly protein [Candidatus Hydrogenedens sp.]